jgi:hypothetical protein
MINANENYLGKSTWLSESRNLNETIVDITLHEKLNTEQHEPKSIPYTCSFFPYKL